VIVLSSAKLNYASMPWLPAVPGSGCFFAAPLDFPAARKISLGKNFRSARQFIAGHPCPLKFSNVRLKINPSQPLGEKR
jgi:hypothetical protein